MAWTTPFTAITGELFEAGDWNTYVRDNLQFLYDGTRGLASDGTKITGVSFPATQVASADANTLDDFEEGTWTPVVGGVGGTSGQAYSIQKGWYVKKGKEVAVGCYVRMSTKGTITGNLQISGLPFASENTSNQWQACGLYPIDLATAMVSVMGRVEHNASVLLVYGATAAAANLTALTTTEVLDTSGFIFQIAYRAGS